jgi:hypothetical protein
MGIDIFGIGIGIFGTGIGTYLVLALVVIQLASKVAELFQFDLIHLLTML